MRQKLYGITPVYLIIQENTQVTEYIDFSNCRNSKFFYWPDYSHKTRGAKVKIV